MMMINLKKDKIAAILGSGLLGYYLAISLFRGWLWNSLLLTLPPINSRNLSMVYLGLIGGAIGLTAGYLLFTSLAEKKPFREYKRPYLIGLFLLLSVPLMLTASFRYQAISSVKTAENTNPTELRITTNNPVTSHIMFQTGEHSASGVAKRVVLNQADSLSKVGAFIRQMTLAKVVPNNEELSDASCTLWLDYQANGHWYSKILSYRQGYFAEELANNRIALYTSPGLKQFVDQVLAQANQLSKYNQARILSSKSFNQNSQKRQILTGTAFQQLIAKVQAKNEIQPDPASVQKFQDLLNKGVPQGNENIYAIELSNNPTEVGTNFMVYDRAHQLVWFNQRYYHAELSIE